MNWVVGRPPLAPLGKSHILEGHKMDTVYIMGLVHYAKDTYSNFSHRLILSGSFSLIRGHSYWRPSAGRAAGYCHPPLVPEVWPCTQPWRQAAGFYRPDRGTDQATEAPSNTLSLYGQLPKIQL